jgi:LmbE family N-acetylglucosaminyl deacetylase
MVSQTHFCGRTLVICPHFDDACFSTGGFLSKKTSKEVTVLTVYSKCSYAPNLKLLKPLKRAVKFLNMNFLRGIIAPYVSEERRKEDQRFCDSVSATQRFLPFKEAPLRGSIELYSADLDNANREPIYGSVFKAIENCVSLGAYDSVLCPLAVGNHVDHMIVLKAFLQMLEKDKGISAEVFFYEDLPYASAYELDSIGSLALKRTGAREPLFVDITVEMPLKQKLMDIYRSQLGNETKESILRHARRLYMSWEKRTSATGSCERFWRLGLAKH